MNDKCTCGYVGSNNADYFPNHKFNGTPCDQSELLAAHRMAAKEIAQIWEPISSKQQADLEVEAIRILQVYFQPCFVGNVANMTTTAAK